MCCRQVDLSAELRRQSSDRVDGDTFFIDARDDTTHREVEGLLVARLEELDNDVLADDVDFDRAWRAVTALTEQLLQWGPLDPPSTVLKLAYLDVGVPDQDTVDNE